MIRPLVLPHPKKTEVCSLKKGWTGSWTLCHPGSSWGAAPKWKQIKSLHPQRWQLSRSPNTAATLAAIQLLSLAPVPPTGDRVFFGKLTPVQGKDYKYAHLPGPPNKGQSHLNTNCEKHQLVCLKEITTGNLIIHFNTNDNRRILR